MLTRYFRLSKRLPSAVRPARSAHPLAHMLPNMLAHPPPKPLPLAPPPCRELASFEWFYTLPGTTPGVNPSLAFSYQSLQTLLKAVCSLPYNPLTNAILPFVKGTPAEAAFSLSASVLYNEADGGVFGSWAFPAGR